MTTLGGILLGLTALIAAIDWWAVLTDRRSLEWVFKPLTMVALGGVLFSLDVPVGDMVLPMALGLLFSMIGDIFLVSTSETMFPLGVGSFLVAHVCYVVGFTIPDSSTMWMIIGGVVQFTGLAMFGPTVLAYSRRAHPALPFGLAVYMLAISVMVVCAFGTRSIPAAVGALLFAFSDFVIGFTQFVKPMRHQRIVIITTYHVAQVLIILSLLSM